MGKLKTPVQSGQPWQIISPPIFAHRAAWTLQESKQVIEEEQAKERNNPVAKTPCTIAAFTMLCVESGIQGHICSASEQLYRQLTLWIAQ